MQKVHELLESFRPGTYIYQPFHKEFGATNTSERTAGAESESEATLLQDQGTASFPQSPQNCGK